MIHNYRSHSLQHLAKKFLSEANDREASNPLEPIWIIVQNNEMKEWLSLQWAEHFGIAGNFKFIFPSEFLWTLFRLKRKDLPQSLPSDLNAMQWALFNIFRDEPSLLKEIPFSMKGERSENQLFHLSAQLADVFDQYQVYRPELIQAWEERKLITKNADEKWQSVLWNTLKFHWNANKEIASIPSRAEAYHELIDWLNDGDDQILQPLPEQLYVFGLSHYSNPFLSIIGSLGKTKKVQIFDRNLNPSVESNELELIIQDWNSSASEQHNLMVDLFRQKGAPFKTEELQEESLKLPEMHLNSCHGSRREVEVLKDAILRYLDENPNANPQDILIMVPDAEEYAALLRSVFAGEDHEDDPSLPISHLYGNQQAESHALVTLLNILNSDFKPSAVLEVLNLAPIKESFSFASDELDIIEEWVLDNHVHRGIGDQLNANRSWRKGLNQLLSGISMEPEPLELYRGMIPYSGVSSSDQMQLTARFSLFLRSMMDAASEASDSQTPLQWIDFTERLIHNFLSDDFDNNDTTGLFLTLGKLREQLSFSGNSEPVSYELIRNWLVGQFQNNRSSSGRFGQGITVSSYVPYRSVPFQFIAVLGLNEGVFPRISVRPDFDLIYADPKAGDRIQKEDDTYLFLETLFAATEHLHISFKGQDQRTDSERLPSSLVQQLIEEYPKDKFSRQNHSLHAFNSTYFSEEKGNHLSFSKPNLKASQNIISQEKESSFFVDDSFTQPKLSEVKIVSINEFIQFFTECSKFMLQNYLQISDRLNQNEISDRESFDLDGLSSYKLSDFLLEGIAEDHPKEKIYNYAQSAALIPDKLKGEKLFEDQFQQVQSLVEKVRSLSKVEPIQVDIDLKLEGIEVYGRISGCYGDTFITTRIGSRKPKYEIMHWLKHLLLLQQGISIKESYFVSKEKGEVDVFKLRSDQIPEGTLAKYMQWFMREHPVLDKAAFFPETSKAFAEAWKKEEDEDKAISKARSTWEPSYHRTFVESNDYYNQLLWRNRDPLEWQTFKQNAQTFWRPFLEAEEGSNEE